MGRVLLLKFVAAAKGVLWLVEQPKGSIMAYHPLFQEFMAIIPTWRVAFAMKSFGGESEKPTWLYASHALAQDLLKFRMTMPSILDDR